ncbi:dTMP kinase [Desulfobotulus sp. H1]|uniref:Thymidylate kinase n=1 Tax=Desulfobotulus pelophilus TaxID=2823377 RepID=A0ABT3N9I4_9BACT|nr:dTMP kinase [Desulfobotulus pelophilus]MCW7753662.1 dTMP kinase [Desulfobotulus pelophilus]
MLITLCGGEGAGKSTQVRRLSEKLEQKGYRVVVTREPGGTAIGRKIRALLLDPANRAMVADTELFLYAADRAQHLAEVVRPALKEGKIVISDRFADSTTVYQGVARGLDPERIQRVHELVLQGLLPDITFLLDLLPEEGLSRALSQANQGTRSLDEMRFEQESLDFHRRIRQGFLALAAKETNRFCCLDAMQPQETLTDTMLLVIEERMQSRKN